MVGFHQFTMNANEEDMACWGISILSDPNNGSTKMLGSI